MDEQPSFAAALRRYRLERGLSREELAEQAGLGPRAVSDLESGLYRTPHRDTVDLLARALRLSPQEHGVLASTVTRRRGGRPTTPSPAGGAPLSPAPGTTGLPPAPTPLLGRTEELAAVVALLIEERARLLTLTGPGGVGKTRLSLDVAETVGGRVRDGVCWVDLSHLGQAAGAPPLDALVLSAIAGALGVREAPGAGLQAAVMAYLREKELLLVLDNFEHVLGAASLLVDLLGGARGIALLVTSRAPLRLRGERTFAVPPLALPAPDRVGDLAVVAASPAVHLFVQRARSAAPLFRLDESNGPVVAAICARLDGLPLALELAAARVVVLSPQELLARLDDRLGLLTAGPRDLPARQRTLRHALAWSYDLLQPEEQALFRLLAVFRGGGSLDAVEALSGCEGRHLQQNSQPLRAGEGPTVEPAASCVDVLAALTDMSLVRASAGADGATRFTMLETVRAFALAQLCASGSAAATNAAHAAYFLSLAEAAEAHLVGRDQAAWLARLEEEHDNLRAALDWALEQGEVEQGLRLAAAVRRFWHVRGHLAEGRGWLERLLARAESAEGSVPPPVRARALGGAAVLAHSQGEHGLARAFGDASLSLFRALDDQVGVAGALTNLGIVARDEGDYAGARAFHEESLAVHHALGNAGGAAIALTNLGVVARDLGDYVRARAAHEESLALQRAFGHIGGVAVALTNLSVVARDQGDLALFQEVGDSRGIATALNNLGDLAAREGDPAAACPRRCTRWRLSPAAAATRPRRRCSSGVAWHCITSWATGRAWPAAWKGWRQAVPRAALTRPPACWAQRKRCARRWAPRSPRSNGRATRRQRRCCAALGATACRVAWEEGRAMAFAAAVDAALAVGDS
jgi:predicted ATPase